MKVSAHVHCISMGLIGTAALAAVVVLGTAAGPSRNSAPMAGAIVHAPSPGYLDFAHRAFDRFRDLPPEQDFNAAAAARSRPQPI